ncbi:MAG: hypothetical protein J5497_02165, partial [Selenomonadaceae bacterium]|nr:hypothetical protein [Selenomonadaceae bacterium]
MANNTNIMSIAPNQPTTPTRRISPSTQPKYKPTARAGKRTFGSTLDQVNMKLDELKQNIQDLQESSKKIAQVEGDEKTVDEANEISAQGKSN